MNLGRHQVNQRVGDLKGNFLPCVCVCVHVDAYIHICVCEWRMYTGQRIAFIFGRRDDISPGFFLWQPFFLHFAGAAVADFIVVALYAGLRQSLGRRRRRRRRRMRKTMILGACYNEDLQRTIVRLTH